MTAAPERRARVLARHWRLRGLVPLASTAMARLYRVRRGDGRLAVLKVLTATGRREEGHAFRIPRAFDGRGMVRLQAHAPDAVLIELCGGPVLSDRAADLGDAVAIPILCDVLARHADAAPAPPPGTRDLAARCRELRVPDGTDPAIADLIAEARARAAVLLAHPTGPDVLQHGDVHHGNVARGRRGGAWRWLAFDPQGLVGDPAYAPANLFGNPVHRPDISRAPGRPERLSRRVADILGLDAGRVLQWGFVHSCLSAAWALADGHDPAHRLGIARDIRPCLTP